MNQYRPVHTYWTFGKQWNSALFLPHHHAVPRRMVSVGKEKVVPASTTCLWLYILHILVNMFIIMYIGHYNLCSPVTQCSMLPKFYDFASLYLMHGTIVPWYWYQVPYQQYDSFLLFCPITTITRNTTGMLHMPKDSTWLVHTYSLVLWYHTNIPVPGGSRPRKNLPLPILS